MSIKKMMPLIVLAAIMILGATFMPLILGTVEAGKSANISTEYQDQLNATDNVNVLTISTTKFVAPIIGIVVLILGISMLSGKKKRY